MKKILLTTICLLVFYVFTYSQIRTVSNALNSPGQYHSLQTAIDSANTGDTIYVHAGSYGGITVNKKLTFIGPGFNAQGQFTTSASISIIYLDRVVPTTTATGSKFIGLDIGYINTKPSEQFQIDSILINRCRFTSNAYTQVLGNNWTFINNLFQWQNAPSGSLFINNYNNILLENNIFTSAAGTIQIQNSNKSTVFFINNLFTGHYDLAAEFTLLSNANFSNNIFFGKSPASAVNCDFANNIIYGNLTFTQLQNGSNGIYNIFSDPQFNSVPIDNSMYQFSYSNDYRLKSTSPGKGAGTDATDIGIFGGQYPMPLNNNKITGEPPIPQIYYMFIQNSVIDPSTPLNVTIKARKMN